MPVTGVLQRQFFFDSVELDLASSLVNLQNVRDGSLCMLSWLKGSSTHKLGLLPKPTPAGIFFDSVELDLASSLVNLQNVRDGSLGMLSWLKGSSTHKLGLLPKPTQAGMDVYASWHGPLRNISENMYLLYLVHAVWLIFSKIGMYS